MSCPAYCALCRLPRALGPKEEGGSGRTPPPLPLPFRPPHPLLILPWQQPLRSPTPESPMGTGPSEPPTEAGGGSGKGASKGPPNPIFQEPNRAQGTVWDRALHAWHRARGAGHRALCGTGHCTRGTGHGAQGTGQTARLTPPFVPADLGLRTRICRGRGRQGGGGCSSYTPPVRHFGSVIAETKWTEHQHPEGVEVGTPPPPPHALRPTPMGGAAGFSPTPWG